MCPVQREETMLGALRTEVDQRDKISRFPTAEPLPSPPRYTVTLLSIASRQQRSGNAATGKFYPRRLCSSPIIHKERRPSCHISPLGGDPLGKDAS